MTDNNSAAQLNAVRVLLAMIDDPDREGLRDTPRRVVDALKEMTSGHAIDPATLLGVTFNEHSREMIIVRGIEFSSLCEHHLLPFTGTADVAYIASNKVVGLSKLARLVDAFARRLQVQERMTSQIADAIETHLHSEGVAVVITGRHACMGCRGVRKPAAEMVTSAMRGRFMHDATTRAEFVALLK